MLPFVAPADPAAPMGKLRQALLRLTAPAQRDVAFSLAARALEAASKFVLYALAARMLGAHASGQFFLCLSVVHLAATLGRMGLEKPLTRHVAAELAVGRGDAARRDAMVGSAAVLIASLVIAAALAAGAALLAQDVLKQPDIAHALLLAALIVPVQNLAYALAYILIGLERSVVAQLVMNALAPTFSLLALLAGARSLDALLIAYIAAFGACALIGLAAVAKDRGKLVRTGSHDLPPLPSLWAGARPLVVVELSQAALLSAPVLLIGVFSDPVSVSAFSIASRLSMLVTTVVLSLGAMAAPVFARHYRLGEWSELRQANARLRRQSIGLSLPLILVMAGGAYPLLALLGVDPARAAPVLWVLLCGQLVFCLTPAQDTLLAMAGQGRILRRFSLIQVALCLTACALLIPAFGAVGAATASASIWILGALALRSAARRRIPQLKA